MCEDGRPHRGSGSEHGDKAARDELLRPEDDRPAPAEIDEADNDGDGDRSPAPRKRLPQGDGHDREERGDRGRAITLSGQRGQVVALTFLYTNCPDVCPLTATQFRGAQTELQADTARVTFIAVSVDPDRDTPQAVQTFSAAHGLASNWFYLVGGRAQLSPVWASYGIGVQAGSATVTHNDAVYLIDKSGRERVLLHSEDLATDLTNDLRALLRS